MFCISLSCQEVMSSSGDNTNIRSECYLILWAKGWWECIKEWHFFLEICQYNRQIDSKKVMFLFRTRCVEVFKLVSNTS